MSGTNDYQQYSGGSGANVATQANYLIDPTLTNGMSSGVVPASRLNKILRQATMASAALGQIIANAGINILDDGSVSNFVTQLISALTLQTAKGGLLDTQYFTSSGTYTVATNNPSYIIVEVWGGGGGGGGTNGTGLGAGGGGSGGYSRMKILASALSASETVAIGSGGTSGASTGSNGGAGGTTSFGSHCSVGGGSGGTGCTSATTTAAGGSGATSGSGDLILGGNPGSPSNYTLHLGGYGGNSTLGGGGGGGGASGSSAAGGQGGVGLAIIYEYR